MHMEVMVPSSLGGAEFNFNSASTSPYVSAPSSPQRFGNYSFSAPTSPTRSTVDTTPNNGPSSNWEEKPGTQKTKDTQFDYGTEFAFDFSGQLENVQISLSADELFDGGKIKPLKPHPSLQNTEIRARESPKSTPMKNIDEANESLSSKQRSTVNSNPGSIWYRKWKLKDLLLFRSASEGDKEKYGMLKKSENEDGKNWSFRSTDSGGSVSSRRLGKGLVSAHERHYTVNRAAAEELKRKTFLPYKRGLLGCLGLTIPGVHELSTRGFSSAGLRE